MLLVTNTTANTFTATSAMTAAMASTLVTGVPTVTREINHAMGTTHVLTQLVSVLIRIVGPTSLHS